MTGRMRWIAPMLIAAALCIAGTGATRGQQVDCAKLQNMALAGGKIVSAARVAPGEFAPPAGTQRYPEVESFAKKLPAFCRGGNSL